MTEGTASNKQFSGIGRLTIVLVLGVFATLTSSAQAAPFAYITNVNSGTVSVIDTETNTVAATIPVGSNPFGVAVNPAGTRVYVGNESAGTVSVIDTATNTVVATIPLGAVTAFGVAINPTGTRVYVANIDFTSTSVLVIDTATNTVLDPIQVGGVPVGVAINPTGTRLYVGTESKTVSVIDTATNTMVATIPVENFPFGLAVNPAGTRVYVGTVTTVSVIDTATNTVVATIPVGDSPLGVAVNPDGTRVYVGNNGSNTVSVIDTATNTVVATIPVGSDPFGVAVNPAGTRVYVATFNTNTVSVIDTATNTVVATIPVGLGPAAFGEFIPKGAVLNTPLGQNVTVQLGQAIVTFANVTAAGDTTLATSAAGPPPPAGFKLGNPQTYYDLATTATFSGSVTVCIDYTGVAFDNEASLKLFHFEDPNWVDATLSLDTATHTICGSVTSLSPFAIVEPAIQPFAALLARVEIERKGREFKVKGTFTLGAGSDGIHPLTEDVALQVGAFAATIPAGSFRRDGRDKFKFKGIVGGARLEVKIERNGKRFAFEAEGKGTQVGTAKPVAVRLAVGNDAGSALARVKVDEDD